MYHGMRQDIFHLSLLVVDQVPTGTFFPMFVVGECYVDPNIPLFKASASMDCGCCDGLRYKKFQGQVWVLS